MLLATLLLIAAPHCADPGFCPTIMEIRDAILRHQDGEEWAMLQKYSPDPDTIMFIRRPRIIRISGVYCGRPDEDRMVICKMTYHHPKGRNYITVRLNRNEGGWKVEQMLEVWREN